MKIRLFIILNLLIAFGTSQAQTEEEKTPFTYDKGLKYCEGTTPYRNQILVSNFGEIGELNPLNNLGKGYIASLDTEGESKIVIPCDGNLSAPKGMIVVGNYLYIADVAKVVAYNLTKPGSKPHIIKLPETELFANDIIKIGSIIIVSVTNTGNLYGIDITNPKDLDEQTPRLMGNVPGANGMVVSENILYIASYNPTGTPNHENTIYYIDITASETKLTKLIDNLPEGMYDGIALNEDKSTIYFTTWSNPNSEAALFSYNLDGKSGYKKIDLEHLDLQGPADISIKNGYVYIPDLVKSVVHRLPL